MSCFVPIADIAQTVLSKKKRPPRGVRSLGLAILVYGGAFASITPSTLKRAFHHVRDQKA